MCAHWWRMPWYLLMCLLPPVTLSQEWSCLPYFSVGPGQWFGTQHPVKTEGFHQQTSICQGVFQGRARVVSLKSCVARMKSGWAHSKQLHCVFKAPSLHFMLCILIPSFERWKYFLFLTFRGGGNMFRKASHQWSNQRNAIHEKINRKRNPPVLHLGRFKRLIYISERECKLKG